MLRCTSAATLWMVLFAAGAGADVLEQAKAAAAEFTAQQSPVPRQRSFNRMMTGLGLAMVGGRLVWYRLEDKDCRGPGGPRCDVIGWGGAAALASGLLLMTVLSDIPASPAVTFEPRPSGGAVRAVVGF